jgi:hypothetical protein
MLLILICALACSSALSGQQSGTKPSSAVEQHIRSLMTDLSPDSLLRRELLSGARGDGIREPWMDEMRNADIRRAIVWVSITYGGSGRPKRLEVDHVQYFRDYAGEEEIDNPELFKSLLSSGLEKKLVLVALDRARHGSWLDIPRPKPQPFVGGTEVEFLDDEWLPLFKRPMYCAGPACIPKTAIKKARPQSRPN